MKTASHQVQVLFVAGAALLAALVIVGPGRFALAADEHSGPEVSPDEAQVRLQEGNERFVSGSTRHPNTNGSRRAEVSKNGQKPFAVIVGCADSRVPVERLFDRGVGDLFVVRVAGNVCDTAEAASVEYAVEHLGTPLVVILGHTQCGAVTAAATAGEVHGPIAGLLAKIKPAVDKAHAAHPDQEGKALVPEAIKANVWQSIEDLFQASAATREAAKEGKLRVVGAIYSLETCKVEWLGSHPDETELLSPEEAD